jgi:4-hydroxyacetophenone monooxygenase
MEREDQRAEGPVGPEGIDAERLRRALLHANLPTLLMVMYQLSGDAKWLEEPYRATRGRGMDDHDDGGFDNDVQCDIRNAAHLLIMNLAAGAPIAIERPDINTIIRMMTASVGEEVPAEYGQMMAEQLFGAAESAPVEPRDGNRPDARAVPHRAPEPISALVVGAGLSGLLAAKRLADLGVDCTILERRQTLGGTWLDNSYPGCGVDTPSHLYSYSFYPSDWTEHFAKRAELLGYLNAMAAEFRLSGLIRFGTEVVSAAYHEPSASWRVTTQGPDGQIEEHRADVLVTAMGQLSQPSVPELPGLGSFRGRAFHSAEWPNDIDVTGRRLVIVGSGASAMQILPAVSKRAAEVTVIQRSPQWIAPHDSYFSPIDENSRFLLEQVPFYRSWYRLRLAWIFNDRIHSSLQIDESWPHPERSVNSTNEGHRRYFQRYLEEQLSGRPDLVSKATPTYPPFGKRMLLDNGWFTALRRANVTLETDEVVDMNSSGVVLSGGASVPADIVVFATGFRARQMLRPVQLAGRGGVTLADVWEGENPRAYLGMTVPSFPNLFIMYGPNTNLGHGGSYTFFAECQAHYIATMIEAMTRDGIAAVECREDVFSAFNRDLDEAHRHMIWTHPGMRTWYRNGRGRVVTNWPWRVLDYWKMTRQPLLDDFVLRRG